MGKFVFGAFILMAIIGILFMTAPDGAGDIVIGGIGVAILVIVVVIAAIIGLIRFIADLF